MSVIQILGASLMILREWHLMLYIEIFKQMIYQIPDIIIFKFSNS